MANEFGNLQESLNILYSGDDTAEDIDSYEEDDDYGDTQTEEHPAQNGTSPSNDAIVSQLYAVFKNEQEPTFGIGYDWDMLFAVYMRRNEVKPKDATGMAWNTATVAEFKNVTNGDEVQFAKGLSALGGSDVCRVSTEVLGISRDGTGNAKIIEGLTQALIQRYFKVFNAGKAPEGLTCKQAYEYVNKPKVEHKESSNAEELLQKLETLYAASAEQTVKNIVSVFEPIYTDILTTTVGFIGTFLWNDISEECIVANKAMLPLISWASGSNIGVYDFDTASGKMKLLEGATSALSGFTPRFKELLKKTVNSAILGGWSSSVSKYSLAIENVDNPIYARSAWHAMHARGCYLVHRGDDVALSMISDSSVQSIDALMKGVADEIRYELHNVFKFLLLPIVKANNTFLTAVENNMQNPQLQTIVSTHMSTYEALCSTFIFLRQSPENDGILQLQYAFSRVTNGTIDRASSTKLKNALDAFVAATDITSGTTNIADVGILGQNIVGLDSSVVNDTAQIFSFVAVTDRDLYAKRPDFAYKPVRQYLNNGYKFSANNVLLGRSLSSADVTVDLESAYLTRIFATSRSGKGVMTLSVLASLLSAGCEVVYGDFKPDMASVFWKYSNKVGLPFLSCEFQSENGYWYKKAGIMPEQILNGQFRHFKSLSGNPTIKQFYADLGIPETQTSLLESNLFGVLGYLKFLNLMYSYTDYKADNAPVYVIVDEVDNFCAALQDSARKLADCLGILKTKKKNASKDEAPTYDRYIAKLLEIFATWFFQLGTQGGGVEDTEGTPSPLAGALIAKSNQLQRMAHYVLIGQDAAKVDRAMHNDSAVVRSGLGALWNNFNDSGMNIFGNFKTAAAETFAVADMQRTGIYESYLKAKKAQYLCVAAAAKDAKYSGFWALSAHDGNNLARSTVFKSYLILNDNDIRDDLEVSVDSDTYTGPLLARLGNSTSIQDIKQGIGAGAGVQHAVYRDLVTDAGVPEPAVGFEGLLNLLAASGNINKTYGLTYNKIFDYLRASGATNSAGQPYSCIEEYIYDFRYDSLMFRLPTSINVTAAPERSSIVVNNVAFGAEGTLGIPEPSLNTGVSDINVNPHGDIMAVKSVPAPNLSAHDSGVEDDEADIADTVLEHSAPQQDQHNRVVAQVEPIPNTSQPVSEMTYPAPVPNPQQTTQDCSAYGNAYTEPISFGKGSDTPFACFHSGGKYNNLRIRKGVSQYLMNEMRRVYGGFDAITTIEEQNGVLIINNIPFTPKLAEEHLALAPYAMQIDLKRGAYASVLFYKDLQVLKRLQYLSFETSTVTDLFFYDNNIQMDSANVARNCLRKWKQLRVLRVYGDNILEIPQEQDLPVREQREREFKSRRVGASVGALLASAIGIETSTADRHPIATQIGKTKLMKAAKTGAIIGGMTWGLSLLFALSNPFLLVGGAVTAAAYAKSKWNEYKLNKDGGTSSYNSFGSNSRSKGSATGKQSSGQRSKSRK